MSSFHFIVCPLCSTVDEALAWFEERGGTDVHLWLGPDGRYRGTARVEVVA